MNCPTCKDDDCVESTTVDNCTACGWSQQTPHIGIKRQDGEKHMRHDGFCTCGESKIYHRHDGPCYYLEPPCEDYQPPTVSEGMPKLDECLHQGFNIVDGIVRLCSRCKRYLGLMCPVKEPPKDEVCGDCGGKQVYVRGRYPNEDSRKVCPTCLAERIDQIRHISDSSYGQAEQAK